MLVPKTEKHNWTWAEHHWPASVQPANGLPLGWTESGPGNRSLKALCSDWLAHWSFPWVDKFLFGKVSEQISSQMRASQFRAVFIERGEGEGQFGTSWGVGERLRVPRGAVQFLTFPSLLEHASGEVWGVLCYLAGLSKLCAVLGTYSTLN